MISRSCGSEWGDLVVLTLLPDGVFSLRQTYRDEDCGQPVTLVYIGQWQIANDGRELRLDNGPVWLRRLADPESPGSRIPGSPATRTSRARWFRPHPERHCCPSGDPFHLRGLGIFAAGSSSRRDEPAMKAQLPRRPAAGNRMPWNPALAR